MAGKGVVDVHCHLFNAQYAVMELSAATWNALWGNYPHAGAPQGRGGRAKGLVLKKLQGVKEYAAWIARLVKASASSCDGNYRTELDKFKGSLLAGRSPLVTAPLMMDIYFALDDNADQQAALPKGRRRPPVAETFVVLPAEQGNFEAHLENVKKLVQEQLRGRPAAKTVRRRSPADKALDSVFDDIRKELLAAPGKARGRDRYEGIELSPGYKKHLHDLEALAGRFPGKVFPFLAVDPRRRGVMKLVEMKIDKGQGSFRGVKLYPPLGYLPTHPGLQPVFAYCARFDVPITVHCSQGGLKNFRTRNFVATTDGNNRWEDFRSHAGNKSAFYAAPANWRPVLQAWPYLRVNFAHFGGGDLENGNTSWLDEIRRIAHDHPNVYADMSYYAKAGLLGKIDAVLKADALMRSRLMFGTDYIMIMMDSKLGGLGTYFDRYATLDPGVLGANARNFLKMS